MANDVQNLIEGSSPEDVLNFLATSGAMPQLCDYSISTELTDGYQSQVFLLKPHDISASSLVLKIAQNLDSDEHPSQSFVNERKQIEQLSEGKYVSKYLARHNISFPNYLYVRDDVAVIEYVQGKRPGYVDLFDVLPGLYVEMRIEIEKRKLMGDHLLWQDVYPDLFSKNPADPSHENYNYKKQNFIKKSCGKLVLVDPLYRSNSQRTKDIISHLDALCGVPRNIHEEL